MPSRPAEATAVARAFHDDERDARGVHDLLLESYRLTRRWRTWTPDRLDSALRRGRLDDADGASRWTEELRVWEAADGTIVGAVHPEDPGEAWIEVHPAWTRLVPEMLAWAQAPHATRRASDRRTPLLAYACDDDRERVRMLRAAGFEDRQAVEVVRGRSLRSLPDMVAPPSGCALVWPDIDRPADRANLAAITERVFGVLFDDAAILLQHRYLTEHRYVAVAAPRGSYAAWCGVFAARTVGAGFFEPVGTDPDHRRRGLASLVMTAGMRWMRDRGLDHAFVVTGATMDANRLYEAMGFEVVETIHRWEWQPS